MNGGIQPTVELATNNGNAYPYPVYPMMGGNSGFGGFGGDGAIWIILIIALLGGFNNGNGGFGGFGGNNDFAWLSNGQKDIMTQTSDGFNSLHLSNQIEGIRDDVNDIQNAICNSTASINSNISNGFYNSEIAENSRQLSYLNSFNNLNTSLLNCCCENRLGLANLTSTVISENCADREALSNGIRDLISNQNTGVQRILDQLCQDKIDAKNEKIADLQRELQMADLIASQIAQTEAIRQGVYNELKNCPVGTVPVFGNQPIFTCSNNLNNGCGCTGTSQFI